MNAQQDWLEIRSLKIKTKVGIHAWEQQIEQTLLLDITLPIQCGNTAITLEQTVDYASLCKQVTDFITAGSFDLIENVARQVADLILAEFRVPTVQVAVSKPWAVANAGNITVRIERKQQPTTKKKAPI